MAKWFGKVGYAVTAEPTLGVFTEDIIEREYYGDLMKNYRKLQNPGLGSVNDNVALANEISILADPYAINNFGSIRYAEFMGVKWKVDTVEIQYPRLILSLGGVWNGDSPRVTDEA